WLVLADGLASFTQRSERSRQVELFFRQFETEVVPRFIRQQRWFAAKGEALGETRLKAAWLWSAERGTFVLCVVTVRTASGTADDYFLPLAADWHVAETGPAAGAALARVRQQARTGLLFDAFADGAFCRELIAALVERRKLRWPGAEVDFVATAALPDLDRESLEEAPIRRLGESSSSAFVLGGELFCKAYRRLRPGANPEWEMSRFLTEVSPCDATVPALGAVELRTEAGEAFTLALVQRAVPNQGDGWQHTLAHLERSIEDALTRAAGEPVEGAHDSYLLLIDVLARRTAELHRALAVRTGDPAFDPEPLDAERLAAWHARVAADLELTVRMLRQRRDEIP